ncbi:MAG: FemAB family PEP-CTERM system-associated protein [Gemmatimonadota bacterium]|nr:FemAB family PEP-CTERM system-associated protein [Gemmatimonadota bacterium]
MSPVVRAYAGDAAIWDAFVKSQSGWTHFHLYGWRDVMTSVFRHDCPYLAAYDDRGALTGVLPLVRVKSRLFGHFLVSMPFLNYGGPLGDDASVHALAEHAVGLAKRENVGLLELRSRAPLPLSLTASHRKITVLLDLPAGGSAALLKGFDSKVRSQVRRAAKDGASTRFGLDQVEPFFDVFARHMRDLGTPTQPLALFRSIAARFPNDVWFGCTYWNEMPVAAGCGFRWGNEFEMTWASALREHSKIAPNMALYWAFMERAADEGVGVFNFGRCSPDSGTHRFKRQWGSRDEPLSWYDFSPGGVAKTPSPDDAAFSWGPRIWRRLPESIATALGPRIVRYIP